MTEREIIAHLTADQADGLNRVKSLVRAGDFHEAVRVYRTYFGTSLKDTVETVRRMQSGDL